MRYAQSVDRQASLFSSLRSVLATIVVIAATAWPSLCVAQGTSGTLPDPIATNELNGYADRLRLSDQQRQAVHMLHDQYRQEFRALRQGEIAAFLKEMRSLQGTMVMPTRDSVESIMKKMEQLTARIAVLDNRLFDQIQEMLTEEQLGMMPRARMARQRVRYASNQMMNVTGPGTAQVDLSEMLRDVELSAQEREAIDPLLGTYETRLTAAMGKLSETASRMMLDMFDAMEALGMAGQDFSDPEAAEKFGEMMQQVWRDIMGKTMEAASALTELNQRTFRSLAPLMSPQNARTLRQRYYQRAYPEAGFVVGDSSGYFNALLKSDELNEDQRLAIAAARDELQEKLDRLAEDAVAMIEAHRKDFSPFDFNSESMQEHYKKIGEMQAKANEMRQTAMRLANEALGTELARTLGQAAMRQAAQTSGGPVAQMLAETVELPPANEDEAPAQTWSGDYFVPAAIARLELNEYAALMQLTDEQKAVLANLHLSYLEKFKEVEQGPIAALTAAMQARWKFDSNTQTMTSPTEEAIERVFKLRREAIQAMHELDRAFFDDVSLAVIEDHQAPHLARVRLWRERAGYNRSTHSGWSWFGGSSEAQIDLAEILRQQRLTDADRKAIETELLQYEQAAIAVFRARFEAGQAMQRAQEVWQAKMMAAQSDGESNPMKYAAQYQEVMGASSRASSDANQAVITLNRETLDRLTSRLSGSTADRLRLAYNRKAFPNIYNDELALEQKLTQVLELPDLGAEQRRRIEDVAAEYRPAYAQWCHQMAAAASESQAPMGFAGQDAEAWQKWQERQEVIASLRFERNELSMRTASQLKLILSPDQIQRIGGLPEPKEKQPYSEWME